MGLILFPVPPAPLLSFLFTSKRCAYFGSLWASFSTFKAFFLLGGGFSRPQAPSRTLTLSMAVACMLAGWRFYARWATNGATAAALEFVSLQTTDGWHRRVVQHTPPRSLLQATVFTRKSESSDMERNRSTLSSRSPSSNSASPPLDLILLPGRTPLQQN